MATRRDSATLDTVFRTCPLCEAKCGIAVEVDRTDGRVRSVRGDAHDPFSRGYLCPKAYGLKGLQEDPDRLRRPLRRVGDDWREIGWEEAFDLVASRLGEIREAHGPGALGSYVGNPNAHDLGSAIYLPPFLRALGTRKRFSASSVDQLPKMVSSCAMFGGPLTIPVPDIDRTRFWLILGANPLASNGSLMTAPDVPGRIRRLRERGGRLVVVDPRRSETARVADEHVFIVPGTDALFLFALVHTLFSEKLVDLGRLEAFTRGVEEVRLLAKDFAPEAVAPATGVAADVTRRLAREFAGSAPAACYGRIGTCTQEFGTLASWLVDVLNTLTGNLDRPGGAMFPRPATGPAVPRARRRGRVAVGRWHSSVRGLPEAFGELPSAALAEEIDSAGDERIRALVTVAGNPVLSTPNGARLARALETLEFMVSVDIYVNETTRFADVILPPTSLLERSNYDIAFGGFSVRNVAKFSPQVLKAPQDSREQWEILAEIAGRVNGANAEAVDELVLSHLLSQLVGGTDTGCPHVSAEEAKQKLGDARGPERVLDLMLRAGPYGDRFDEASDGLSLAKLREAEHGLDLGALEPRLPELLDTASGAVELAPELIVADVPRLRTRLDELRHEDQLLLVGRRHLRSNNSWMHNVHALAKGRERCTLLVNPADAERLGLRDGGRARVRSRAGELEAPVVVSDEMMPGVVSLPHGFGHTGDGVQLRVARDHAGVNSNLLTDESRVDPLSGNGVLNGIPVELAPA
ncbi:MAG: molybdopterin oxidoreductase family protein [Myxococcota bacterium]